MSCVYVNTHEITTGIQRITTLKKSLLLLLFCGVAGSNPEGARGQVSEKKIWVASAVASAVASLAMLAAARWTTELAIFPLLCPNCKRHLLQKPCKNPWQAPHIVMGRVFSQQQIIFHRELCCLMSNMIHGGVAFLLAWYFSFCWPLRCPCYWCCYYRCCYCWEHWQWCLSVCFLFNSKLVHF